MEPTGLSRSDGKRPDGLTLVPWSAGKSIIWDVTVVDTLAASYITTTSKTAGAAAEIAVTRKEDKYAALSINYDLIVIALETLDGGTRLQQLQPTTTLCASRFKFRVELSSLGGLSAT